MVKTTTTLQHLLCIIAVLIRHFHAKTATKSSIIHSVYKNTVTTMLENSTHVTCATEHFPSTLNSEIIEKANSKLSRIYAATQIVGKEATHSYDMKKHERTHIKNNLKCEWCAYEIKDRRNLMQHIRTHTREKPYSCSKCQKKIMFYVQKK